MNGARPYRYPDFNGNETVRLLQILPGDNVRVQARLIPAAFDEDLGCVRVRPSPTIPQPPPIPITDIDDNDNNNGGSNESNGTVNNTNHADDGSDRVLKYEAVSWAWGDPTKNAFIEILDDESRRWTFSVSHKLEEALRAVRSLDDARLVWIDAVCINQEDQNEKSYQVPMMDKIYSLAERVLIWLGPQSEDPKHDARTAFGFLKKLLRDMDYQKTISASSVQDLKSLSAIMQRDWFSRRWVVQEIALAKKATIFCDDQSMDWLDFSQAIEQFVGGEILTKLANEKMMREASLPHYWKDVSAMGAARLVSDISKIRRLSRSRLKQHGVPVSRQKHELLMSLEEIVCRLETFQTSKPHDTIYAYLALAKDAVPVAHHRSKKESDSVDDVVRRFAKTFSEKLMASPFIVDYKHPYSEVCRQFIKFAVRQNKDRATALDILCRPWAYEEVSDKERSELNIPTWVTTIAYAPFELTSTGIGLYRRNGDALVGAPGKSPYNAADGRPVNDKILHFKTFDDLSGKKTHSLIVSGFILDEIDVVRDTVTTSALVPENWLKLGGWEDTKKEPPMSLWKTLVADRGPNGSDNTPLSYPRYCAKALQLSPSRRNLDTQHITSHPEAHTGSVADFCRRVQEVVVNRRMIKTKNLGRLGLVSGRMVKNACSGVIEPIKKGDLICVLHGCSVPVVLRRVEKSKRETEHEDKLHAAALKESVEMVEERWRKWQSLSFEEKERSRQKRYRPSPRKQRRPANNEVPGPLEKSQTRRYRWSPFRIIVAFRASSFHHRTCTLSTSFPAPVLLCIRDVTVPPARPQAFGRFERDCFYEFWGECYIDEMMDGYAVALQNDQKSSEPKRTNMVFELR
ncbi:heterokaryon incompatibility protein-domain-containing protein [Bombardia bombarda]|uniref:Heterokaryon incompatibility protein-domain-containing protein n=1 Tax=Bombardia bombarda TaxID=252184 RepID=A0AA39WZN8_9PEZI|nr:heterokaryon incompatibility protein-domain-containing protein [Bombardia bombarda]